jgi:hypothetical protein
MCTSQHRADVDRVLRIAASQPREASLLALKGLQACLAASRRDDQDAEIQSWLEVCVAIGATEAAPFAREILESRSRSMKAWSYAIDASRVIGASAPEREKAALSDVLLGIADDGALDAETRSRALQGYCTLAAPSGWENLRHRLETSPQDGYARALHVLIGHVLGEPGPDAETRAIAEKIAAMADSVPVEHPRLANKLLLLSAAVCAESAWKAQAFRLASLLATEGSPVQTGALLGLRALRDRFGMEAVEAACRLDRVRMDAVRRGEATAYRR